MAAPFHKPVVCPVLIDRISDLATLHALIDQAKSGRGQVVLLSGEAGIGKSRLVAEAKAYAAAQDVHPIQGNCFQADISNPYAPLFDLMRLSAAKQLAAAVASELAPFACELHQSVGFIKAKRWSRPRSVLPNLSTLVSRPSRPPVRVVSALPRIWTAELAGFSCFESLAGVAPGRASRLS